MKTDRKTKPAPGSGKLKTVKKARSSTSKLTSKSNGKHLPSPYENVPIGIVESSPDGKYLNVNKEFCRILGYEKQELLKSDIKVFTYEEDYPIDIKLYEQLVSGELPFYKLEKRYVRKDGGIVWAELTRSAVRGARGKLLYILSTVVDISERKKVEAQVKWQAHLLAELGDAVLATNDNYVFTSWNKAAEQIYGWKAEEVIGKKAQEILQTEFTVDTREAAREQVRSSGNFSGEVTQLCKDGTRIAIEAKVIAIRDDEGNIVSYVSVNRDITERKQAEAALRESQQRFSATYEYAPIGIVECSLEGKYLKVNEEFCRIVGYQKEELIGHGFKGITHDDDYPIDIRLYQKLVAGEIPFYRLEKRYVRKNGETIWVEITRSLVRGVAGNPLYSIGAVFDISERKQVERVLRESAERLRIATESARMFTWEWDFQKRIYTLSDNFDRVVGFASGLLPKNSPETILELSPAEDVQVMAEGVQQALEQHGDLHSLQCRVIDPASGQVVWLEVNGKIVYNQEGNAERMFGVAQNITERKRTQEEIAIISRMPEENPNPVMRLTRDGEVLYANKPSQHLLETWKQQIGQALPNELQKHVVEAFGLASKKEIEVEQNGKMFYWTLAPIHEAGYVNLYGTEITERKRAERVLAESARRQEALYQFVDQLQRTNTLEDVFNAALDAILSAVQCDRASILLYDDTKVMRFVAWRGLSDDYRKAIDGHSPWTPDAENPESICINDVNTADLSDPLRAVIKGEGIGALAFIPLVSNGKLIGKFMTYYNASHVFSAEEVELSLTIARQLAFGIDRKRAEEKLRQAASFDEAVMGNMGEGLYTVDSEGKVTSMNPAAEKMFGWTFDELRGHRMHDVTHYKHPDGTPFPAEDCSGFQVLHNGRKLVGQEDVFIRKDGTFFDVVYSSSPLLENGKINGLVVVFSDNTARKQAEKRLVILSEISDLIRRLEDPNELLFAVSEAVGDYLQARRCMFNEIDVEKDLEIVHRDYCRGVESVAGMHKISDYSSVTSAEMAAGKTVVNYDSKTDPRTASDYERSYVQAGERAYVAVPLMRENHWVASLWVSDDQPRPWSQEDVSLLEAIAERVWTAIEKLRINTTLQASESLYRTIARSIPGGGVYVVDKDMRYLVADGAVTDAFGFSREMLEGHTISEVFQDPQRSRMAERLERNFAGETISYETEHNGRVYWTQQAPLLESIGQAIIVTIDVTERKQIEEELRQSEERFAQFMYHFPGLAWIKDTQGRYVYANAAAEKVFHTTHEELYGKTDHNVFPPNVAAQFQENDEQALLDENGIQVVETLEHEDGVLHYSLVNKFPIPGPDGSPALIGGTAFDITESLQAEEALRESEERFRAIVSQATAGIVRKDAEGGLIFVNQAFCNMLGYTDSELLGKAIWEFMHEDNVAENKRSFDRLMEEGIPFKLERRFIRQDGSILWVDSSVSPIMDADGKPQSAVTVEVDITGRKQAEEALQQLNLQLENRVQQRTVNLNNAIQNLRDEIAERRKVELALRRSEATSRLLFNTAPDAIVIADELGIIVHVNAQIANLFGYDSDEILGNPVEVLIPERFHDRHMQHRRIYKKQRMKRTMGLGLEIFGRRKNGSEFPVDVMLTPITNIPNWDVMVTIRDNTERKEMEGALHKSHERLRILSQRLVEVQEEERRGLARELHDRVGQTLAALNINLIIINSQLTPDSAQQIGTRLSDSMKLVAETIALVRDVMTDLRPAVLDDYGLEAALESHITQFMSRYDINVKLEKPGRPISRLGPSIEMTFLRIAQEALMNIARHAQATQVDLSLRQAEDAVFMIIQDNGTGIVSWESANRPGSHGLTIMRERAEAFGGTLGVKSIPGQGTIIEVSIPFRSPEHSGAKEEKL